MCVCTCLRTQVALLPVLQRCRQTYLWLKNKNIKIFNMLISINMFMNFFFLIVCKFPDFWGVS